MSHTLVTNFSKDHWSTLLYLECRVVNHKGQVQRENMRCNPNSHPGLAHLPFWDPEYGSKLRDGTKLPNHDDWDCVDDMEAEGLLELKGTGMYPIVQLTDEGWALAHDLQRFLGNGGTLIEYVKEEAP